MWKKNQVSESHSHPNKSTLDKLTDNGTNLLFNGSPLSGGGTTEVSISGRGEALFSLRGGVINVVKTNVANDNTVTYSIPTLDTNRYRKLFIWTSGALKKSVDIPDGVLLENDALVYNASTNALTTKNASWGNVSVSTDEYLLLYNNLGVLGGLLSKYVKYGGDSLSAKVREIEAEQILTTGTPQGIFIVDGRLYTCANSNDSHTDYSSFGSKYFVDPNVTTHIKMSHNFGHMNAPTYSKLKDCLLVANGSKDYTLLPKGWIVPNFKSLLVDGGTLEFNTVEKIELDFTQFTGEYKGQLCWGYETTDICYLMTNDNRTLRKIQLGKGSENLGSGTFLEGKLTTEYNGSYSVLNTWQSRKQDILGGMFFYKGYVFTGVKGEYGIRKCIPLDNGYFDTEYLQISGKYGDMQGIAELDGIMYLLTDYRGYKTDSELFK